MRWRSRPQSSNVEDRRNGRLALRGRRLPPIVILLVAGVAIYLGADPRQVVRLVLQTQQVNLQANSNTEREESSRGQGVDEAKAFVSVVLADTEETWGRLFKDMGGTYREPVLVLFRGQVSSACGFASAAIGPFYCPSDRKVYLDLSFFQQLARLGAPGDFAAAYVIAHEVGHHVQNLLGVFDKQKRDNASQVVVELQADCYAGVWAHFAQSRSLLEPGDLEEGLQAAATVGDDHLQGRAGGAVRPETFTHGSSAQRVNAFKRGFAAGDPAACAG